ncbi:MAG TPA: sec-independent translocase [Acidothermaceae bacterium]|jgi:sec-independent protein translocase protein TatB
MPFDLSITKLLVLGVIAMLIFGPDKLPQVARDAGRVLRQLRSMAQQARSDLRAELGDTVGDFDIADLNPRTFVRKHLLDDDEPGRTTVQTLPPLQSMPVETAPQVAAHAFPAAPVGPVPFDTDAT